MIVNIVELLSFDFISSALFFYLFNVLSSKKLSLKLICIEFIYIVLITFLDFGAISMLGFVLVPVLHSFICFIRGKKFQYDLFCFMVSTTIGVIIAEFAVLISLCLKELFHFSIVFLALIFEIIMFIVVIWLFKRFKILESIQLVGHKKESLTASTIIFLFILVIQSLVDYSGMSSLTLIFAINFILFTVAIVIFVFLLLLTSSRNSLLIYRQQKQLHDFEKYSAELSNNYYKIDSFRHDYKNLLIALGGVIEKEGSPSLKKYFNELTSYSKTQLFDETSTFSATLPLLKNTALKSLIISKADKAQLLDIDFNCDVTGAIHSLIVNEIDVIRIVSILLDNAIEATQDLANPTVNLCLDSFGDQGYDIIVQNTLALEYSPDLNNWLKVGYSLKDDGQGHGLPIVSKIIGDNPNMQFDIAIVNNTVIVTISVEPFNNLNSL